LVLLGFTASSVAADAIPRSANGGCPIGYYSMHDYCIARSFTSEENKQVIEESNGKCPYGYGYAGDGFCVQNSMDAKISNGSIEKVGDECPSGYYPLDGYCRSAK
jgi:hypothetical protein